MGFDTTPEPCNCINLLSLHNMHIFSGSSGGGKSKAKDRVHRRQLPIFQIPCGEASEGSVGDVMVCVGG